MALQSTGRILRGIENQLEVQVIVAFMPRLSRCTSPTLIREDPGHTCIPCEALFKQRFPGDSPANCTLDCNVSRRVKLRRVMIGQGYSLWLTPQGVAGARLGELLQDLSKTYNTPRFSPHVTLLARISQPQPEVVARTRELARDCRPLRIKLDRLAFTDNYFRSLFINAALTPALKAAHRRARELFDVSRASFMPHLSVLYGDLSDAEKHTIIARLNRDYPARFTAEGIDVYATLGRPEDWRLVESVALTL